MPRRNSRRTVSPGKWGIGHAIKKSSANTNSTPKSEPPKGIGAVKSFKQQAHEESKSPCGWSNGTKKANTWRPQSPPPPSSEEDQEGQEGDSSLGWTPSPPKPKKGGAKKKEELEDSSASEDSSVSWSPSPQKPKKGGSKKKGEAVKKKTVSDSKVWEGKETELSEYERIRLENIREREALFASLGITKAKDEVSGNKGDKEAEKLSKAMNKCCNVRESKSKANFGEIRKSSRSRKVVGYDESRSNEMDIGETRKSSRSRKAVSYNEFQDSSQEEDEENSRGSTEHEDKRNHKTISEGDNEQEAVSDASDGDADS